MIAMIEFRDNLTLTKILFRTDKFETVCERLSIRSLVPDKEDISLMAYGRTMAEQRKPAMHLNRTL
jgi:hypothetical protein